jgi:hypothetical protein
MSHHNRRCWSIPRRRGITEVVEYSTPQAGIISSATKLELSMLDHMRETLGMVLLEQTCPSIIAATTARNQDEGG